MCYKITRIKKHTDKRGDLIVFYAKSNEQIYFVTFNKRGVIRGNHYHKKWREWFGVVSGKILVVLENVKTKKRVSFILDSSCPNYFRSEIFPYTAHAFKSLTSKASLLNYADSEWTGKDDFKYKLI